MKVKVDLGSAIVSSLLKPAFSYSRNVEVIDMNEENVFQTS